MGVAAWAPGSAAAATTGLVPFMAPALEGQLNLNTATAAELDLLPGVGPSTAQKILTYREGHPFKSIRQLLRIKGIGKKTFERLAPYLAVEGESTLRASPG
jgi:competence protein ComEA